MMNESPDPADQKWFNTDAGRTIIGASIVGAFMIIVAAVVLIGGQANQTQQRGEAPGSRAAPPTNPTPAPATPPVSPSAPTASAPPSAPAPPSPVIPPATSSAPTYTPTYSP